jgi:hypothetical protein
LAYRYDKEHNEIVIDGFQDGISPSPYLGIGNMRNVGTHWMPGVAYVNYRRQAATLTGENDIDFYSESNYSGSFNLYSGGTTYIGQQFKNGPQSQSFTNASFYLSKTGSPTGNITAYLYYPYSIPSITVSALVVGGGGGGGGTSSDIGGGGGGGQVLYNTSVPITPQAYSVTVGTGGAQGVNGNNSVFNAITALGGSKGNGSAGSGGASGSGKTGGTGNNSNASGGGGGDTGNGANSSGNNGGAGGTGTANSISGSSVTYSVGGGGGGQSSGPGGTSPGPGSGGGGADSFFPQAGSPGNNGIVIISCPTGIITATGGTHTTSGGNDIWTFTTSGTWTITSPAPATIVATSSPISASTLTGTPTLIPFTFSSTSLSANTTYLLGLSYTGGDVSDTVNVGYGITNEYTGMNAVNSTTTGSYWAYINSPTLNNLIYHAYGIDTMANPVQSAQSPAGLNYILDTSGQVWKQSSVNSSTFSLIANGPGRLGNGNGGIAYWNNYIVVFGDGLIEFCGNGTGDAAINSSNWNLNTAFFPLNQQTFTAQQFSLSGAPSGTYTGGTLAATNHYPSGESANWGYASTSTATIILSTGQTITGCTFTNGSSSFTTPSTVITGSPNTLVFISSPGLFHSTSIVTSGQQITFTTTGILPFPLQTNTVYYAVQSDYAAASGNTAYAFNVATTPGGTAIVLNTQGTGTHTFEVIEYINLPIGNVSNLTFTQALSSGTTSATIAGYTLPNGTAGGTEWLLPTGIYNLIDSNGNNISATFTLASGTVNFAPAISQYATGNFTVNIINPNVNSRAYTSTVDGNLYFINGQSMGAIIYADSNVTFNPGNGQTYAVQYSIFELATGSNAGSDSIVDMTDLQTTMVVAGKNHVYTWDYTSSFTNAPVPLGEPIQRIKNLLNSIYITAGQKGNVYVSNGSYVQLMYKIPDYVAGVIDPVWTFGDTMTHRGKIYFQAMAQNTSGTNILAGIFSLIVSPAVTGEVASGLVMEAQNSYGLTPVSGATGAGILIDNVPSSSGQDSYYSVYSTGSSSGAIDYNDTTVWQNFEPTIETDIIPIGTFLDKKTPGQIQFMLDRELATGDQIELSWRQSLSDSYTTPVVTSTTTLANAFGSNLAQIQ